MALSPYLATIGGYNELRERENKNALARQAGGMLASGDQAGARNALWQGGELEAGSQIDQGMAPSRKSQAEAMDKWTQGLGRILQDPRFQGNPEAAWQAAAPFAERLGLNPEALAKDKPNYDRDPEGWATFWNGQAQREKAEFAKGSDGSYTAADPYTGRPLYQYQAPTPDKYEQFDPEKEIRRIPGRQGSQAPGTPGFNPNAPDPRAPRNQRNANPGNIEDGPFARSLPGYAGSDGRFARFSDPNAGQSAQLALLDSYGKRGLNTVAGIINRWAPPSENDTQGYARFVAQKLGVDPNQPLDMNNPQVKQALAAAITTFEGGPGSGGRTAQGGPELVRPAQPKKSTANAPPSGFRWKADGSLEPIPGGPADTISQGGKVTGEERTAGFLASRLADSLKNLSALDRTAPDASKPGLMEKVAENAPWVGGQGTANLVRSADRQQVIANQLDVLDAALTLGTGAAYTREQLVNYRDTYFPALTDKPATVTAKRQKLIALLNAAKIKAGRSAPPELDVALEAARQQWGGGSQRAVAPQTRPAGGANATQAGKRLSPDEAAKLKPGTRFIGQDGVERIRK
jgi:hypothetical protein